MGQFKGAALIVLFVGVIPLMGCQDLAPHHLERLFKPSVELSEIVGFIAGLEPPLPPCQTCLRCLGAGQARA
jgi:hypothetical protein